MLLSLRGLNPPQVPCWWADQAELHRVAGQMILRGPGMLASGRLKGSLGLESPKTHTNRSTLPLKTLSIYSHSQPHPLVLMSQLAFRKLDMYESNLSFEI